MIKIIFKSGSVAKIRKKEYTDCCINGRKDRKKKNKKGR